MKYEARYVDEAVALNEAQDNDAKLDSNSEADLYPMTGMDNVKEEAGVPGVVESWDEAGGEDEATISESNSGRGGDADAALLDDWG